MPRMGIESKNKKRPHDWNSAAFAIVQEATGQAQPDVRNQSAVHHGKLGGLKGGKARAESLADGACQ